MKRRIETLKVSDLRGEFPAIEFPEYQREPNLWTRSQRQLLIDSILRTFDIASVYFYERDGGTLECIDGRQRLNAIMSFLNENPDDDQNGFPFKASNEISVGMVSPFGSLDGRTYDDIKALAAKDAPEAAIAKEAIESLDSYPITAIHLSDITEEDEFNLQFLRLNLGVLVNAGEKLNAMVGDMRSLIFAKEVGLGSHPFLKGVRIPIRRFSKEQVATQVVAQVFSLESTGEFTRARHFDLQRFMKDHAKMGNEEHELAARVRVLLDNLEGQGLAAGLKNRAITVSVVLLAWRRGLQGKPEELAEYRPFVEAFLDRLQRQVEKLKLFQRDERYDYLVEFQRHVTQASVEKPAVRQRHEVLARQFSFWLDHHRLTGDPEPEAAPRD